jgi:hypothetical protein
VAIFSSLFGGKKKPAAKPAAKTKGSVKDPRADLISTALALHKTHGAEMRAALTNAVKALKDRKTLRNPAELARLLALVEAHRAMGRLFSHDLRRYLVLSGLRQWTGKEPQDAKAGVPAAAGAQKALPRTTVVRR